MVQLADYYGLELPGELMDQIACLTTLLPGTSPFGGQE
jgi:hypothetical protein